MSTQISRDQFGNPGEPAFRSPYVYVLDQFGQPMRDMLVRFTVSDGSLERTEVRSDSLGLAAAGILTLRSTEGEDVVTATVDGVEPLRFRYRVRFPVEVAHYSLESLDGTKVPVVHPYGGITKEGTLSFYADDTWVKRTTALDRNGAPYTWGMQGSYSRENQRLTGTEDSPGPNPWRLHATFSDDRLMVYFSDPVDEWQEIHVKVRANASWP